MSRQKQKIATKAILTLFMSVFTLLAFAQGRQVSGTILDDTGEPLIGVNVIVKGTTNGTITDFDGNFTLNEVDANAIISASYIGYLPQEITIGNQSVLNIVLKSDTQTLDEVVVVGYGIQKKSDVTGSVSSVNSETLTARGATSVMESMQGAIPGVDITQNSSRPGAGFNIQIRGKSSMQGGEPLYVVDGVVAENIDFLNPADIERIDILKDASSTAIYGSRATNGVVMVTTKAATSSDKGKAVVTYDGYYGVKQVARMPNFMNGDEFADYRFARYTTYDTKPEENGGVPTFQITPSNLSSFWCGDSELMKNKYLTKDYTDWPDLVTQNGQQQNHFIGISGNAQSISYRLGIGYQSEDGVFLNENYKRYNVKAAIDHKINDFFTAGASVNLSTAKQNAGSKNAVLNSFRTNPFFVPYDENGDPYLLPGGADAMQSTAQFSSIVNPLLDLENSLDQTRTYDVLSNIYFQITPIKDLLLKTTLAPTYSRARWGKFDGVLTAANYSKNANSASIDNRDKFSWTWDNQINYNKTFGDHSISGLYVFSMYKYTYEKSTISVLDMPFDTEFHNIGSANTIESKASEFQEISMLSHTFRFNYSYKGKYLATVSSRWDGSSKFAKGSQWGAFPSMALAWRMSEEEFLQKDWLTNLKLRASFGLTGNNAAVGAYGTQVLASQKYMYNFDAAKAYGYGPSGLVNTALSWEKSKEFNIGLDFGLFNGRVNGTIDYYNKLSSDLLMERQMPLETGGVASHPRNETKAVMWDNVGKVRNSGVEIMLNTVNVQTRDWRWETTFTFSKNKNKIVELYGGKTDDIGNKWFIGQPIDVLYNYQHGGIVTRDEAAYYSTTYGLNEGEMKVVDQNNDGVIDDNDRIILGSPMPDWTGSITSNLYWKNFDFSVSLYTKQGSMVYSPFMVEFTDYKDRGRSKIQIDYYIPTGAPILNADGTVGTSAGKSGSYPYPTNDAARTGGGAYWGTSEQEANNHYVDNSYVKIKNITLGYTFPKQWIEKAHISHLRLYFNVLNPFVFTKYKGFDPEWADAQLSVSNDGTGGGGPSSVTYQVGVNLKF